MRIFVNYEKGSQLRYLSHLDVQRLLQRALRRADLPLAYSQGFNPHPLMAFASALAVGHSSRAEWLDVQMAEDVDPQDLIERMNRVLPEGFLVHRAVIAVDKLPTLTAMTTHFTCEVTVDLEDASRMEDLKAAVERLPQGPIVVNKKTKAGMRDVDMRPQLVELRWQGAQNAQARLWVAGLHNAMGSLNMELILKKLLEEAGVQGNYLVHRTGLFFEGTDLLPAWEGIESNA